MNRVGQKALSYWQTLPKWFRVTFSLLAFAYIAVWSYSALLSMNGSGHVYIPILPKDSSGYSNLSDSIIHNHSFYSSEGKPETFRTPGYPIFLTIIRMLIGDHYLVISFIQVIMMLVTGLLIQNIGTRYLSPKAGSLACLAFLLNPVTLVLSLVILSDTLFVFLYVTFFWLISERLSRNFWLVSITAGIIASAALYVRPMGVLAFPIFLAPIILTRIGWKKTLLSGATIALISFLLISPWMLRNQRAYGVFEFTSLPTFNITSYNIPMYLSHKNGDSAENEYNKIVSELGTSQEDWRYLSASPQLKTFISNFIKKNFLGYSEYHIVTTLPFFFSSDLEWSARLYHIAIDTPFNPGGEAAIFDLAHGNIGSFISKLTTPWWKFTERLLICLMAFFCIYALVKNRKNLSVWMLAAIIIYLALLTGPVSDARYRFPADPFIYLLASSGVVLFLESRSQNTPSPRRRFLYRI